MTIHQIRIPEIHTFTEGVVAKGISIKKAKTQALYEAGVFDGVYALTNTGMTGSDGAILSNLPSSYITSFEGLWNTFLKPSDYAVVEYDGTGNIITPLGRVKAFSQHLRYVEFTQAVATILVNNITSDDIINAVEAGSNVSVTGLVGGDATTNDLITFVVNGTSYSGLVALDNTFSISVPGPDLVADLSFDVTINNAIGTSKVYTATTTSTHTVDLTATATITIDDITTDNIINAAESGGNVNVTGSVGGDASISDTVSATVNGNFYNDVVTTGNVFSLTVSGSDLAAQTSITVSVDGSDAAGNLFSQPATKNYTVDITATASITVSAIATDDIINRNESITDLPISGTVSGDATLGDIVSFTLNGTPYSTNVLADDTYLFNAVAKEDLTFGKTFLTDPSLVEAHSFDITVTGNDAAGNPFASNVTASYTLNYAAPTSPNVTIDAVTADNNVDVAEAAGNINVTGTVTGADVVIGQAVNVVVNSNTFSGAVLAGNVFSIPVTGSDLFAQTMLDVDTTNTNSVGNAASSIVPHTYTTGDINQVSTIVINELGTNDYISGSPNQLNVDETITGTVSGDFSAGDSVTISAGDTAVTTVDALGNFTVNVNQTNMFMNAGKKVSASHANGNAERTYKSLVIPDASENFVGNGAALAPPDLPHSNYDLFYLEVLAKFQGVALLPHLTLQGPNSTTLQDATNLRIYDNDTGLLMEDRDLIEYVSKDVRIDNNLQEDTVYNFYMVTTDGVGESARSDVYTYKTPLKPYEGLTQEGAEVMLERYLKDNKTDYGDGLEVTLFTANMHSGFAGNVNVFLKDLSYSQFSPVPLFNDFDADTSIQPVALSNWAFLNNKATHPDIIINIPGSATSTNLFDAFYSHYNNVRCFTINTTGVRKRILLYGFVDTANTYEPATITITPEIDLANLQSELGVTTDEGFEYIFQKLFNDAPADPDVSLHLYTSPLTQASTFADLTQPTAIANGYAVQTVPNSGLEVTNGRLLIEDTSFVNTSGVDYDAGVLGFGLSRNSKFLHYAPSPDAPITVRNNDTFLIQEAVLPADIEPPIIYNIITTNTTLLVFDAEIFAKDAYKVTGYIGKTDVTIPLANDPNWQSSPTVSITHTDIGAGNYETYFYAKDKAGNISTADVYLLNYNP